MKSTIKQRIGTLATAMAVLGIVAAPAIASAAPASNSANTNISVDVGSSISISTLGTVSISLTPTSNGTLSSAKDTVTVSTNNTGGYNLKLADSDATTNLVSGSDTFTASSNAIASAAALSSGKWGFAVAKGTTGIGTNTFDASYSAESNNTSSTSKWAGVPATGSGVTIKSTAATATNDTTDVWYAAKADTTQPNGTYTDTVTYTATTN